MSLYAGEIPPNRCGEHVAGEVFASDAAQNGFALVLRCDLRAFERGFRLLHSGFERFELFGADALDADADRGLLADDELILRFAPLAAAVLGEGA